MDKFNKFLGTGQPVILSIYRVVTGLMLFQYGVAKLLKFPVVPVLSDVSALSLYGVAAMFELVFGGLLILGLFSRLAAFILSGEMAFGYFISHFPKNFIPILNGGSLAIMLCFSCLYLCLLYTSPSPRDS